MESILQCAEDSMGEWHHVLLNLPPPPWWPLWLALSTDSPTPKMRRSSCKGLGRQTKHKSASVSPPAQRCDGARVCDHQYLRSWFHSKVCPIYHQQVGTLRLMFTRLLSVLWLTIFMEAVISCFSHSREAKFYLGPHLVYVHACCHWICDHYANLIFKVDKPRLRASVSCIIDIWWSQRPGVWNYTCFSVYHKSFSRIDHFLLSHGLKEYAKPAMSLPVTLADHNPLVLNIDLSFQGKNLRDGTLTRCY